MSLKNTLSFIYHHPLCATAKSCAIFRFVKWQVKTRLRNRAYVFDWINDSKLLITRGMTGATGNIYVGLMEYSDMSFLLHYLGKNSLFMDIGANVGVYSVLAAKVCCAKTISIEPLPNTFAKLQNNIKLNAIENMVIAKNIGLSFENSVLKFTNNLDTQNSVANENDTNTTEVPVKTLDELSAKYGTPNMIKIDVEGFESNVLRGGGVTLKAKSLDAIIIELNGSGTKFGFSDDDIDLLLRDLGFRPFFYDPFTRHLSPLAHYGSHNTIYIRATNLQTISNTLKSAQKFHIKNLDIYL